MAAVATTYFGNMARAAVIPYAVSPGTPVVTDLFTVGRGWEANITWETAELYGTDSLFRVDEAKHTLKAEAKLKGCKFYPDNAGTGGVMDMILNSLYGGTGGDGTIVDTNVVYLMDVWIYARGSTATPTVDAFTIKLRAAYLESVPIPFPENDFITLDLTFKGRTASIVTGATIPA
jgi:hypothetical protein